MALKTHFFTIALLKNQLNIKNGTPCRQIVAFIEPGMSLFSGKFY